MIAHALEMANEALTNQIPRVMTLNEVQEYNNQDGCVWFEQITYNPVAAFILQDGSMTQIISPYILGAPINHMHCTNDRYNKDWRCWKNGSPTPEQIKEASWE